MINDNNLLSISLLGNMEITRGLITLPDFSTKKSRALFVLLILNAGCLHSRNRLVDLLWNDVSLAKAKKCLRTELWRVRKAIACVDCTGNDFLNVTGQGVCFNPQYHYSLDVNEFETRLARVRHRPVDQLNEPDSIILKECVALYQGNLLENQGLDYDWFYLRRESLRSQYLVALEMLMQYYMAKKDWNNAIVYGDQLLSHDALLEHVHLHLMRCYCAKGNRPAAINQYQYCRKLLSDELGVSPMSVTEQAYRDIIARQSTVKTDVYASAEKTLNESSLIIRNIQQAISKLQATEEILVQSGRKISD